MNNDKPKKDIPEIELPKVQSEINPNLEFEIKPIIRQPEITPLGDQTEIKPSAT